MSSAEELVKVLCDNQASKCMYDEAVKNYKKLLKENILQQNEFTVIITAWLNKNFEKFLGILREICIHELPKSVSITFFLNVVVPLIMDVNTNNDIRDLITDVAFMLIKIMPISSLPKDEVTAFLTQVNTRYIEAIGQLRERNYTTWHRLWIFLVRFCGKHIHYSTELTNKLLRVVEVAFRNSSHHQRISGYDCWKEIIDNAALDMNYICSPKQIKLLVTPLKAKFSKQESVICKRFEVFAHLLKKLQHKAVLCLSEFLEFCFGPLDDLDPSKSRQGKKIPQLWSKSAQVLMEIIGHSHSKSIDCIAIEEVIKLDTPIITHLNFQTFYKLIIYSVRESTILLKNVSADIQKDKAIKCMWRSIFNLIMPALEDHKQQYFEIVSDVLNNFIKSLPDDQYYDDVLHLILTVLISYDVDFSQNAFQSLPQLLPILFRLKNIEPHIGDSFKHIISHSFTKITLVEDKIRLIKNVMENITDTTSTSYNVISISKIWLCLADELVLDLTIEQIENFSNFKSFFMWPIHNLNELDDHVKKQILFCWVKLYKKMNGDDDLKKTQVLKKLEIIFKSNPLLSFNIVSILAVISQFETKFTTDFVKQLLEVTEHILQLPSLKPEEEQKIITILNPFFDSSLDVYQQSDNNEIISSLCNCIKHILLMHKYYKILETLTVFLKTSTEQVRKMFSNYLSDTLSSLFENEDSKSYAAKEVQKILAIFNTQQQEEKEKKIFVVPTGRSARIASLAKNSPKSPLKKSKKAITSSPLRLFGKDLDSLSPLKVKGSQLKNTPKTTPKKVVNIINNVVIRHSKSLHEENSSDFVPINSEVKFDPKKLNEHQKEVMKQRRDNIPALYEDLSQSSQSLFSSKSNSNSNSTDVLENREKDRKRFVPAVEYSELEHANFPIQFTEVRQEVEVEDANFPIEHTKENETEDIEQISSSESDMFKTESVHTEENVEMPNLIPSHDEILIPSDSSEILKTSSLQSLTKGKNSRGRPSKAELNFSVKREEENKNSEQISSSKSDMFKSQSDNSKDIEMPHLKPIIDTPVTKDSSEVPETQTPISEKKSIEKLSKVELISPMKCNEKKTNDENIQQLSIFKSEMFAAQPVKIEDTFDIPGLKLKDSSELLEVPTEEENKSEAIEQSSSSKLDMIKLKSEKLDDTIVITDSKLNDKTCISQDSSEVSDSSTSQTSEKKLKRRRSKVVSSLPIKYKEEKKHENIEQSSSSNSDMFKTPEKSKNIEYIGISDLMLNDKTSISSDTSEIPESSTPQTPTPEKKSRGRRPKVVNSPVSSKEENKNTDTEHIDSSNSDIGKSSNSKVLKVSTPQTPTPEKKSRGRPPKVVNLTLNSREELKNANTEQVDVSKSDLIKTHFKKPEDIVDMPDQSSNDKTCSSKGSLEIPEPSTPQTPTPEKKSRGRRPKVVVNFLLKSKEEMKNLNKEQVDNSKSDMIQTHFKKPEDILKLPDLTSHVRTSISKDNSEVSKISTSPQTPTPEKKSRGRRPKVVVNFPLNSKDDRKNIDTEEIENLKIDKNKTHTKKPEEIHEMMDSKGNSEIPESSTSQTPTPEKKPRGRRPKVVVNFPLNSQEETKNVGTEVDNSKLDIIKTDSKKAEEIHEMPDLSSNDKNSISKGNTEIPESSTSQNPTPEKKPRGRRPKVVVSFPLNNKGETKNLGTEEIDNSKLDIFKTHFKKAEDILEISDLTSHGKTFISKDNSEVPKASTSQTPIRERKSRGRQSKIDSNSVKSSEKKKKIIFKIRSEKTKNILKLTDTMLSDKTLFSRDSSNVRESPKTETPTSEKKSRRRRSKIELNISDKKKKKEKLSSKINMYKVESKKHILEMPDLTSNDDFILPKDSSVEPELLTSQTPIQEKKSRGRKKKEKTEDILEMPDLTSSNDTPTSKESSGVSESSTPPTPTSGKRPRGRPKVKLNSPVKQISTDDNSIEMPNLTPACDEIPILKDNLGSATPQTPTRGKRRGRRPRVEINVPKTCNEIKSEDTEQMCNSESDLFNTQSGKSEDIFGTQNLMSTTDKISISQDICTGPEFSDLQSSIGGKKSRVELELHKLQMNIVGAETFTARRRTRPAKEANDDTPKRKRGRPFGTGKRKVEKIETKRGSKRKLSRGDENDKNEDIIESSQESFMDITSFLNSSKKRSKMDSSEEPSLLDERTVVQKDIQEKVEEGSGIKEKISSLKSEHLTDLETTQDLNIFKIDVQHSIEEEHEGEIFKEDKDLVASLLNLTRELLENPNTSRDTTHSQDITHIEDATHSQDTTQTQDTTENNDSSPNITGNLTQTQETESITNKVEIVTQDTAEFCSESQYIKIPVVYFNLPQKPELTESEKFQCNMDTMSLETNFVTVSYDDQHITNEKVESGVTTPTHDVEFEFENEVATPIKGVKYEEIKDLLATPSTSSIPSSPITSDTPKRTSELLSSTLDISPINSKSSSSTESEQSVDIPIQKNINLQDELTEEDTDNAFDVVKNLMSDINVAQKIEIIEDDVVKTSNVIKQMSNDPVQYENSSSSEDDLGQDENVLIEIEGDQNADIIEEIVTMSEQFAYNIEEIPESGDSTSTNIENDDTVLENDQNVSDNVLKTSSIQERSTKLLSMLNVNSPRTFNKRRSSNIGMSPSTGRIRRLMLSVKQKSITDNEDITEEDILTFKREIPSPLARPRNSILKRKLSDVGDEGISPCPKRKRVNFSDPCLTSKKVFIKDEFPSSCEAKKLFDNFLEQKEDGLKDIFDFPDGQGSTESENAETEPSLEIVNPFMLRKDRVIYPKLVDCQDDVIIIAKKVTSPLFLDILMKKLQAKKIKTIGDLAQLCEVEINRLPFKVPVVANVYKALDNYYKKKGGKEESEHIKINGLIEEEKKDVLNEMEGVINRAKTENVPIEDLATKVLSNLNSSQTLNIFKTYKFSIKDILEDQNIKDIIKYLINKFSISNIFKEVKDLAQVHDFSTAVVEFSANESLTDILRNHNVEDLRKVLTEENLFETKQILEKCLVPLIREPKDIYGYLSTLKTIELSNIVIERLKNENLDTFLNNLSKSLAARSDSLAVRTITSTLQSEDDIFETFKCSIEKQNEESRKNIMLKMFRFIGDNLNVNTCLNLHVELLNKISNMLVSKDSGNGSSK